jgi:uncharacterized protein (TIGR00255 family)
MALMSMTGHADRTGSAAGLTWAWEARSVNGRGLDIRLRLPEGTEGLDPVIRQAFGAILARGNVTVALRLGRGEGGAVARLNLDGLDAALVAAREAERAAADAGIEIAPMTAAEILALRGVMEIEPDPGAARADVREALAADVTPLAEALCSARRAEGAALAALLHARLDDVARLVGEARVAAEARAARSGTLLRERVAALLDAQAGVEEARLAQELALLAVKADVTEELDRLETHVAAARSLVAKGGPVGRKLDFQMQEFNREANTLCAKAQSADLTAIGLDLKVVIDQMREQVQNVE